MIDHIGADASRPLTPAVRAGDWLYVSGQASTDPQTGAFVSGSFDEEFHRSIANLDAVLAEAGAGREQIVRIGAFVRDEDALPRYNELYLATFAHPRPARTTVAMGFSFLRFEIEAVVYLGDPATPVTTRGPR
ncbi:RidA family protein [Herbiconiux sp. P17]|uniref:RidA family protein n=1 Tax=Herbiconiux wuyangfengii TaxID=3342794 RepID=UPI0035B8A476